MSDDDFLFATCRGGVTRPNADTPTRRNDSSVDVPPRTQAEPYHR